MYVNYRNFSFNIIRMINVAFLLCELILVFIFELPLQLFHISHKVHQIVTF